MMNSSGSVRLRLFQAALAAVLLAGLVLPQIYKRHAKPPSGPQSAQSNRTFAEPVILTGPAADTFRPFTAATNDLQPRLAGDVNGDEKDDLIVFGETDILVAFSNGGGFEPPVAALRGRLTRTPDGFADGNRYPRLAGDVNGDGKDDLIAFGDTEVYVAFSNGGGFEPPVAALRHLTRTTGGFSDGNRFPRLAGDVNGDGKDDLIAFGEKDVFVAFSQF